MGTGDAGGDRATSSSPTRRNRLLGWGLPRDPVATRHLMGFAVTTVVTVVVTRALLAATGFPQLGGDGLHIAHVLWGGLLMAVAMVLTMTFAGPVVRPVGAFVGGIGFGLFIDEIGKFLTDDNDYFYEPAPALMYVTLVALVLGADWLHRRRPHHPSEHLAGAADYAVSGLVGGLTTRARGDAERLLEMAGDAPRAGEVRALLDAIPEDDAELLDPIAVVSRRLGAGVRRAVRAGWSTALTLGLLLVSVAASLVAVIRTRDEAVADGVAWLSLAALVSIAVTVGFGVWGLVRLRSDRVSAFLWFRRAALVSLLVTQVAVFRFVPVSATAGLAIDLALLGIIAGERWRLREESRGRG